MVKGRNWFKGRKKKSETYLRWQILERIAINSENYLLKKYITGKDSYGGKEDPLKLIKQLKRLER